MTTSSVNPNVLTRTNVNIVYFPNEFSKSFTILIKMFQYGKFDFNFIQIQPA